MALRRPSRPFAVSPKPSAMTSPMPTTPASSAGPFGSSSRPSSCSICRCGTRIAFTCSAFLPTSTFWARSSSPAVSTPRSSARRRDWRRSYGLRKVRTLQKPLAAADLEAALREPLRSLDMLTASELKQAISRGQIVVHYQPKVMMSGGQHAQARRPGGGGALGPSAARPDRAQGLPPPRRGDRPDGAPDELRDTRRRRAGPGLVAARG